MDFRIENLKIAIKSLRGESYPVNGVSFQLQPGKTFALVGESGSGKTLTALAILQLLPENAFVHIDSKILFNQQNLLDFSPVELRKIRGCRIGMIFQEPMSALNPVLTVGSQIAEVLKIHTSLSRKARKQRILQLLTEVGIRDNQRVINAYPHQLSGGMKQRICIAMAIAIEPEILIADEPTTALDVTIQAQILNLLRALQAKKGLALLLITHDLGVVKQMADEVGVMYAGQLVEKSEVIPFFEQPQHPYSQKLLASLPSLVSREARSISLDKVLTVDNLSVHFAKSNTWFSKQAGGITAVDQVSFELYQGETLAIVGESGSGKTTLGRALLQLIPSKADMIRYDHHLLQKLSAREMRELRKELQIVFQDPFSSLNPRMMVLDIIKEGMLACGIVKNAAEAKEHAIKLITQVGLPVDALYRYPHEFSGGQRQRISIARAIAVEPKILVCDEPTSALDVSVQAQILELLKNLQARIGLSYILITHNIAVVGYLADRVMVMRHGQVVEQGPVWQILKNPQHPYTQELIAAVPWV